MIKKIQTLLEHMAQQMPGILAAAMVTVDDGMSIAETSAAPEIETAAASAYLASIVKSNLKAIRLLADKEVTEDILITTGRYHFIIRHVPGQPIFLFLMTTRKEWLAMARALIKRYEPRLLEMSSSLELEKHLQD